MNEVDREKISNSVGRQANLRNENIDYKKFNYNEKNLEKQENAFEKSQIYNIPV